MLPCSVTCVTLIAKTPGPPLKDKCVRGQWLSTPQNGAPAVRSRGAGHNCQLFQKLCFSSSVGSQPLPELTVRSTRSLPSREEKSEAKGDPSAGRAVPPPTRHSPAAPKEGQTGDRIHQRSRDHKTG